MAAGKGKPIHLLAGVGLKALCPGRMRAPEIRLDKEDVHAFGPSGQRGLDWCPPVIVTLSESPNPLADAGDYFRKSQRSKVSRMLISRLVVSGK